MSVEEARLSGSNIINFTLDLGKEIAYSAISFEYIVSIEELIPIAIVIEPGGDTLKNMPLTTISRILNSVKGYVYGSDNGIGILIPIENEAELYNKVAVLIPQIVKQILGIDVRPIITNYSIEKL
ncbi:MAG: hypothetical protein N3D82_02890 [Ignisphaera sp.]|nr:hypothetical protein [Ignisphaera sp.]MCX8167962.1 hypothetical protein [Ignisphaera sp.]MDW8085559.1 hypothetical protein [Ignisphaera sp.]